MLGRWRTQQSAKHLEEERLSAERERSASDAASPRSPASGAASPRTPDTAPPSGDPSPRSPGGSFPSTPVALDASTSAQHGTPAGPAAGSSPDVPAPATDPATVLDSDPATDPVTVLDSDPATDPAAVLDSDHVGGADTSVAAKDGVTPDTTAPGDAVRDTPTSTKEEVEGLQGEPKENLLVAEKDVPSPTSTKKEGEVLEGEQKEDLPVAEKEVTSSENDQSKTTQNVPTSNNSETRQDDAKQEMSNVEDPLKAASEIPSGDLERLSTVGHSSEAKSEQISEDASKIIDKKPADVMETMKGRGDISPRSKNSSDGRSSEADSNESDSNSSRSERQKSKSDILHCEFGRKMRIQYHAQSPRGTLHESPHGQIVETYSHSRSTSPFETINYLSHSSLGQCAQRTFGAAKANPVTGCVVSLVEKGVRLVTAPVVPFIRLLNTPLHCADRLVYEGFSGLAHTVACATRAGGVCCLPDCHCDIPILYTDKVEETAN